MRPFPPPIVPRAGDLPAAAVPPGRRPAVHRRPHRGASSPQALAAVGGWLDRIFSPLVTLWVFLGPGPQRRPLLPRRRRPPDRPPRRAGAEAVLRPDRGLLPGPQAPARGVLLRRGLLRRPGPGRPGRPAVAVEGAAGLPVRRHDGHHAGHPGEPGGLPAGLQPGAGPRASRSPGSGRSSRWRAGRSWTWGSAGTPARARARSACSAGCGTCSRPGDVLLGDRLMADWASMLLLQQRGRRTVSRLNKAHRRADFRRGRRLGKDDHLVRWKKPTSIRSVDRQAYNALPDVDHGPGGALPGGAAGVPDPVGRGGDDAAGPRAGDQGGPGRAVPGAVEQRARPAVDQVDDADGRAAVQDAGAGPQGGLGARPGLQPDPHGHGPGRGATRRRRRGRSASRGRCRPWRRSSRCSTLGRPTRRRGPPVRLYHELLEAIATHRVADRPDRFEPRVKKRRRNHYGWLTEPRAEMKRKMAKGVTKN